MKESGNALGKKGLEFSATEIGGNQCWLCPAGNPQQSMRFSVSPTHNGNQKAGPENSLGKISNEWNKRSNLTGQFNNPLLEQVTEESTRLKGESYSNENPLDRQENYIPMRIH